MTRRSITTLAIVAVVLITALTISDVVNSLLNNHRVSDFSLKGGDILVDATLSCNDKDAEGGEIPPFLSVAGSG